jgi:hypothetical protein
MTDEIVDVDELQSKVLRLYYFSLEKRQLERRLREISRKLDLLCHGEKNQVNIGRALDELEERQRSRKTNQQREACKRALWFCDSFSVNLLSVSFQTQMKNELVHLTYHDEPATEKEDDDNNNQAAYAILYLMDKFGISDQFYHEFNPFLPRYYRIKAIREKLSSTISIKINLIFGVIVHLKNA